MGFFSKLFSKKTNISTNPIKVSIITNEQHNPTIPPFQGDYAKTIFLWAHEKASSIRKDDDYARYFLYECGISNPSAYHLELLHKGYFEKAPSSAILNTLKVVELKQILTSLGQTTTGKKEALVDRVIQNADENTIKSICTDDLYVLSETGKLFLEEHYDYVLIHKHKSWGIDWKEYDANHHPETSFYDTVWGILNKRVITDKQYFGRHAYLNMYQLLEEEGKREQALEMLLRVLYIDFSGVFGLEHYTMYYERIYTKKKLLEFFDVIIMAVPGVVNTIAKYKDVYSDSIIDRLYEQELPVQICDKTLFCKIVHSVLDGTYNEDSVNAELKSAYSKFVNQL